MTGGPAFVPTGAGCWFLPEQGANRLPIVLSPEVHELLRVDAVEALRSLPRRGLEIGGILLGKHGGSIVIDSIEPVESEHLYGPRYRQSDRDRERFAEVFRMKANAPGQDTPVGLYRTVTLEGQGMDAADSDWMRAHFSGQDAVLLIVAPKLTGRVTLSCFRWDRNKLVPCHERAEPVPVRPEGQAAARPAPKAMGWLQEAGLAAIAAVLVFGSIFLFHHEDAAARVEQPARVDASPRIGLRAEFTGKGTTITWDNKSDLFRTASGALLTVEDAGARQELPISLAELQTGSIEYGPTAPTSSFHLTVFRGEEGEVRESASAPQASPPAKRPQARPAHPVRGRRRLSTNAAPSPVPEPAAINLPPPVTSGSGSIFPK